MRKLLWVTSALMAGICQSASADESHSLSIRAIGHAPLGVMGDHLHSKGEFMMSYRYMRMDMEGNLTGSDSISAREIVGTMMQPGQFMVAPTSMPMDMHMLGAMYGLTDKVTLMGMVNIVSNEMDHLIRNGRTFTTESSGLGDTKVSAMVRLVDKPQLKAHWSLGLSIPTGSIDERDDTPAMSNAFLPYPMQLGSGTYDLLPSATVVAHRGLWSYGAQASAEIRTGDNDEGYALGDRYKATAWVAKEVSHSISLSVRLEYVDQDNIDGRNPALNPMMVQTANTNLQSFERLDAGIGLNYLFENGHRIALEYSSPVSQSVDGPQMELDSTLTLGWQKAF